jgi:PHS family inorganic phosphate transporter-like MFS transporter
MLQYRLYHGKSLPAGPQGFIKAAANIGSVIGQFGFGAIAFLFTPTHLFIINVPDY